MVNTRYRVRMEIHRAGSALGSNLVRLYIAAGSAASVLFTSAVNLPVSASVQQDMLWKTVHQEHVEPGHARRDRFRYWKMFAQPHGPSDA